MAAPHSGGWFDHILYKVKAVAVTVKMHTSTRPKGGSKAALAQATKEWVAEHAALFATLCQNKIKSSYIKAALRARDAVVATSTTQQAAAILLPGRSATELYIELICAKPGGGHGKRLFDGIRQYAINRNCTSITLRAATAALIPVYQRWGFKRFDSPCGQRSGWWASQIKSDTKSGYFMTMCLQPLETQSSTTQMLNVARRALGFSDLAF